MEILGSIFSYFRLSSTTSSDQIKGPKGNTSSSSCTPQKFTVCSNVEEFTEVTERELKVPRGRQPHKKPPNQGRRGNHH